MTRIIKTNMPYEPPLKVIFSEPEETYEDDDEGGQRPITKLWSEVHNKKGRMIGLGVTAPGHNLTIGDRKEMMRRLRETLVNWVYQSFNYAIEQETKKFFSDPGISRRDPRRRKTPESHRMNILMSRENRKPVIIDGVEYPSINEAHRKTGISKMRIRRMLEDAGPSA